MSEDLFNLGIKALIKKEGKILLLQVNKAKLSNYQGEAYWDIPGGRVQQGDSVIDTLKREVAEETGITSLTSIEPLSMTLANIRIPTGGTNVGLILWIYLCEAEKVEHITLSDEHIDHGWFTPGEAAKLLAVKYPTEFTEKLKELEN